MFYGTIKKIEFLKTHGVYIWNELETRRQIQ